MVVFKVPVNGCNPVTIVLGRRGTYNTQEVTFDLSYLVENYGAGTAALMVKRSQDTSAYPAVVSQEDNILTWVVSDVDTYYPGSGECELMWYVDEGLAKTIIYPLVVMRDILQTTEEPPDGYENWIEHLTGLGAETQQNAQEAEQSATEAKASAKAAAENAEAAEKAEAGAKEAASTAQAAAEEVKNLSVDADTLAAGEPATVEKAVDPETGAVTLNFGIPRGDTGATGPQGPQGVQGQKGDSAVVYTLEPTVSAISYDPNASFAGASITVNAYRTTGQGARESFTAQEFHLLVGTASQTIARQDLLNASSATLIIPSTATPDMHVTGYISAWVNNQRVTLATVEVPFIREGLDGTDGEAVRPYIIEASAGAITYNPNATAGSRVSPATVTFNVYRVNVDGTRTVQTVDTIIAFFAQADGTEIMGRIMTDASSLTINSPQKLPVGSYLCCRISDGSTVLRELRIPVIYDGVDGTDGASDAGEVTYDPTETYQSGTAGAALNDLSRHLSDVEENQIPELKSALTTESQYDFTWLDNKWTSDVGNVNGYLGWHTTGPIPLPNASVLTFITEDNFGNYNYFFDAEMKSTAFAVNGNTTVSIPQGVVYFSLSCENTKNCTIYTSSLMQVSDEIVALKTDVSELQEEIKKWKPYPLTWTANTYVSNITGNVSGSPGWHSTDKIDVLGASSILINCKNHGGAYNAWYDANGEFIPNMPLELNSGENTVNVPTGAKYFALSCESQYMWEAFSLDIPDEMPAYWKSYMDLKMQSIRTKLASISSHSVVFQFITDLHLTNNAMNSSYLVDYIRENANIRDVVVGGDILNSERGTDAIYKLYDFYKRYCDNRTVCIVGNHDMYAQLPSSYFYNILDKHLEPLIDTNQYNPLHRSYFHIDNYGQKCRYIFLDTYNWIETADQATQYQWLIDTLNSTTSGWDVIVFQHIIYNTAGNVSKESSFATVLGDYNSRNTGSVTVGASGQTQTTVTYDFTNANGKCICDICGHLHDDYSSEINGVRCIGVTTDAYGVSEEISMTPGTTTEQAFDVFFIDLDAKTIDTIRIGAGSDRSWTYS